MSEDEQQETLGSVGEEATKLLDALQDWARTSGDVYTGAAAAAAGGAASSLSSVNEHLATGSAECRVCPLCRAISLLRGTSPEVRAHLTSAASSLLQAAACLMATQTPDSPARDQGGVETIDLSDDDDWEEEE